MGIFGNGFLLLTRYARINAAAQASIAFANDRYDLLATGHLGEPLKRKSGVVASPFLVYCIRQDDPMANARHSFQKIATSSRDWMF